MYNYFGDEPQALVHRVDDPVENFGENGLDQVLKAPQAVEELGAHELDTIKELA